MLHRNEIQIRDPFILADGSAYYLYGTTDKNCWSDTASGFECYRSTNPESLDEWEGPFNAFTPPNGFWADRHFWAPEVHKYKDAYYMFASFKAEGRSRGTQILKSHSPIGPFECISAAPITPDGWECLDGTLYIDSDGSPWIIFCREWTQTVDGEMYAARLSNDLTALSGEPIKLFSASEANWTKGSVHSINGEDKTVYVTDGPYIYKTHSGKLLMIWSSGSAKGYAVGVARSESGRPEGPWTQDDVPLFDENGGHGMIFKSFDGKLYLTLHSPNNTPNERPCFFEIEERGDSLILK